MGEFMRTCKGSPSDPQFCEYIQPPEWTRAYVGKQQKIDRETVRLKADKERQIKLDNILKMNNKTKF